MRFKTLVSIILVITILVANVPFVTQSVSPSIEENRQGLNSASDQAKQLTSGDTTSGVAEPRVDSLSNSLQMENDRIQKPESGFFNFESFVKDIGSQRIENWSDLAYVDEDSTELVIGVDDAQLDSYIVENGGKLVSTVSMGGKVVAYVADVPLYAVSSFVANVKANGLVKYVEPNIRFQSDLVPNDPYWNLQWGPQKIEADFAWNSTKGDPSVLVAVIDTGVDYTHPDLAIRYVSGGLDWVNNDNDPLDDNGHGTHVSGTVAASINNGLGIAGVARVGIMAEKGLDLSGGGWEDDLANAIIHAVDQGADILSNSWGGPESALIHEAVKYAYSHGVLVVAAAGNSASKTKLYPAAFDEVVAVTATDRDDSPASFTSYGDWVEVAAPGVDIYSTMPTYHVTLNDPPYNKNQDYDYLSGTSMATPHVSGVAGLIWSQFPSATRDWLRAQLRLTADDLGDPGFDEYYGYGRINARRAVEQMPPDHDLLIYGLKRPRSIQPKDHVSYDVSVLNYGLNDENDVTVQLLVNDDLTDSALISNLANGTVTTVSLWWDPQAEGTYNSTVYVVPVPDETVVDNNIVSEMVSVRYAINVLWDDTHDGDGDSLIGNYLSLYELLTANGFVVDELTIGPISSEILASYDILVLVDPEYDFTSSEITDIHNWVAESGALIIIPDSGYPPTLAEIMAPYDVHLTGLGSWYGITTNIVPHPVTEGVDSIYYDLAWQLAVTSPAEALAWTQEDFAFLSVTGDNVVVVSDSNIMDNYGLSNADNEQLMLNMFTWVRVKYEHELTVRVDAPAFLEPGDFTLLNATVYNRGTNNETDVELFLFIDGTLVNDVTIPKLDSGTSYKIDYLWTPTTLAKYNITAYAPPVPNEYITSNNVRSKYVSVQYPLIRPVAGQWANYTLTNYDSTGKNMGTGYWNLTYDHYVEPHLVYVTIWMKDPSSGYISTGWMTVNIMSRLVTAGYWAGLWYPGWVETNIDIGSTINLLYGQATVNGSKIVPLGIYPIDCWELPYNPYTFDYDKVSGLWIRMYYAGYPYNGELLLADTNILIGTTYEHELATTLEAPSHLEPGGSSILNATAYNVGLNTENNVKLSLLIDGIEVQSETIPTLEKDASYTLSYMWTPTVEAVYNVTAYVEPVPGEFTAVNNVVTKMVPVRTVKGYVLFDQTHWTDPLYFYEVWISNLTDRGYIVDALTTSPITLSKLEGYDVFVIPQAHDYYSSDETSAIEGFVRSGGGLLVIGDDSPYIYTSLTSLAGITWEWGGYYGYTRDITPHRITDGVRTVLLLPSNRLLVTQQAKDIIRDSGKNIMLAVSEVGVGAVIAFADDDALTNYYITVKDADNLRLANNMIDWLKSRPPIPSFTYSPLDPHVGETVAFDASASYDTDGTIVEYLWDFGDGAIGSGVTTTHVYVAGGTYNATLTTIDNEALNATFAANVAVTRTTLEVEVQVGTIHFRGELAEFYILVSSLGSPVDAEIKTTLYFNGILTDDLSTNVEQISSGFYRLPYAIPADASAGTYALLVEASYLTLNGAALGSFLISPTLTGWNALLININGTLGTVKTDLGLIIVELSEVNARLVSIQEGMALMDSDIGVIETYMDIVHAHIDVINATTVTIDSVLGTIQEDISLINGKIEGIDGTLVTIQTDLGLYEADLDDINARLTSLDNTVATIQTSIGSITTDITNIKLEITEVIGTTATIQTTLGTVSGTITSIEDDVATIKTDIGDIKETLENLPFNKAKIVPPPGTSEILVYSTSSIEGSLEFSGNVLTISTSGPSGTTGTTYVVIPKQLLSRVQSSIDKIAATVDDIQEIFTYNEQTEAYLLTIAYTHSSHTIKIYLAGLPPPILPSTLYVIAIAVIALAVCASLGVYILKIRKPKVTEIK